MQSRIKKILVSPFPNFLMEHGFYICIVYTGKKKDKFQSSKLQTKQDVINFVIDFLIPHNLKYKINNITRFDKILYKEATVITIQYPK